MVLNRSPFYLIKVAELLYNSIHDDIVDLTILLKKVDEDFELTPDSNKALVMELFLFNISAYILAANILFEDEDDKISVEYINDFMFALSEKSKFKYDTNTYIKLAIDRYPCANFDDLTYLTDELQNNVCTILNFSDMHNILIRTFLTPTATTTCNYYLDIIKEYRKIKNSKLRLLFWKLFPR